MSEEEKREVQLDAVRELKEKGVTGIKLELEGTMQRRNITIQYDQCSDCNGEGNTQCNDCNGLGWQIDSEGYETDDECESCESRGNYNCTHCSGQGRIARNGQIDWSSDTATFRWFINKLGEKVDQTPDLTRSENYDRDVFPWMSFAKLYYDGSVDTEVTFTVRLDNEENIFLIPKVIEVYKEMAETIGQGLDVRGAGMHTALIFDEDCRYPNPDSFPYSVTQMENFKKSLTQLLPAFYFLATATSRSRAIGSYRPPIVGGSGKQTAIGYNGGAIEFRIFDTCYERPEATLDNIVVLKNVMKYMSSRYKNPGVAKEVGISSISFGNDDNQKLSRLYMTADQIGILYAGLPKLMPEYYTIEQLCEQREFKRTLGDVGVIERENREQVEAEYAEYLERFEWQVKAREHELKSRIMRDVVERMSSEELKKSSPTQIDSIVKDRINNDLTEFKRRKQSASKYINDRLVSLEQAGRGRYTLSLT